MQYTHYTILPTFHSGTLRAETESWVRATGPYTRAIDINTCIITELKEDVFIVQPIYLSTVSSLHNIKFHTSMAWLLSFHSSMTNITTNLLKLKLYTHCRIKDMITNVQVLEIL